MVDNYMQASVEVWFQHWQGPNQPQNANPPKHTIAHRIGREVSQPTIPKSTSLHTESA